MDNKSEKIDLSIFESDPMLKELLKIYNNLPGCLCWKNAEGYYIWNNSQYLIGINSQESLVGKNDQQLWPNEYISIIKNDKIVLSSNNTHYFEETLSINGKKNHFISTKTPLKNQYNKTIGVIVNLVPINNIENYHAYSFPEINTIEQDTILSNNYLRNIIESVPGSIYWKDKNGVWVGANTHTFKTTGISAENLLGKTDYELWPEHAKELRENDIKVMNTGCTLSKEESVILPNGKKRYYAAEKMPLRDSNGKVIGIIGNSIDITELKETQEKLAKAQLEITKEQEMRKTVMTLVGDIVHDLTTPISTIYTDAVILKELAPKLKDLIKEARESKLEKLNLINDAKLEYILNKMPISQIESVFTMKEFIKATLRELSVAQKYQDGTIAREDLNKCSIRRVLENVMEGYPRQENLIINQCFSSYDFIFMGNSILMMKVLFNLIKNAEDQIIANGKGEITITTKEAGDKNILIIKDTGGGAPPEVVENFFKDFFTTKKGGTGIGLAFCKRIMHNFGGDITFHSNFGESIEFILSFPKVADPSTPVSHATN